MIKHDENPNICQIIKLLWDSFTAVKRIFISYNINLIVHYSNSSVYMISSFTGVALT